MAKRDRLKIVTVADLMAELARHDPTCAVKIAWKETEADAVNVTSVVGVFRDEHDRKGYVRVNAFNPGAR